MSKTEYTFVYSDKSNIDDSIFELFSKSHKQKYMNLLVSDIANTKIEIIDEIGKGSFGNIYKIYLIESNGNKIISALKHIKKSSNFGLSSLLEPYIMLNLNECNYLTKSYKVHIDVLGDLQIMQPLAISDVSTFLKNNNVDNSLKQKWNWQLICAISHLHSNGILHGDIKAKNLLIFNRNNEINIRLTDFGLSLMLIDNYVTNYSILYTPTHRPIEIFKKQKCSYSADIWALGCTFYEIEYNSSLFPICRSDEKYIKNLENFKGINSWFHYILKVNEKLRPTIWNIIYENKRNENIFDLPIKQYYPTFTNLGFTTEEKIESFANLIYSKNNNINKSTCYLFVHKLIYGTIPLNTKKYTYKQLQEEIKLCKITNFNFF